MWLLSSSSAGAVDTNEGYVSGTDGAANNWGGGNGVLTAATTQSFFNTLLGLYFSGRTQDTVVKDWHAMMVLTSHRSNRNRSWC